MLIKKIVGFFKSLKLTAALLAFAIVLVFVGTIAQADEGLYAAQSHYFRQWLVVGAHLFGRHIPIILPAAQRATDMLARELQMHFAEGDPRNFSESAADYELNFASADGAKGEQIVSIPEKMLARGGEIQNGYLPFAIRVKSFWKNSDVNFRAPMMQNAPPLSTNGVARNFDFKKADDVRTMDQRNIPTVVLEFSTPAGPLGVWVASDWVGDAALVEAVRNSYAQMGMDRAQKIAAQLVAPQAIEAGGKKYTFTMQPARVRHPFS